MIIQISELVGPRTVLAGAIPGSNLLAKVIPKLKRGSEPEALFLDLRGIDVITSSYLQQGILGIRDHCRKHISNLYPVIANASEDVIEEMEQLLEKIGDAVISCRLDSKGKVSGARVLGILEEKQEITLDAVRSLKVADARTLLEQNKDKETIVITGWNNRLSALTAKGLLMEIKKGRSKYYQPVLEM